MAKRKHTPEQIIGKLLEAEVEQANGQAIKGCSANLLDPAVRSRLCFCVPPHVPLQASFLCLSLHLLAMKPEMRLGHDTKKPARKVACRAGYRVVPGERLELQ